LTNDIPNVSEEATKDLDENGMIRMEPRLNQVTFLLEKFKESDPTQREKLLRAIFGIKQVM
jgi:DNA-directed RNA polymerase subunit beta